MEWRRELVGEGEDKVDPMQDKDHCFNTYYSSQAAEVFKHARGRLL